MGSLVLAEHIGKRAENGFKYEALREVYVCSEKYFSESYVHNAYNKVKGCRIEKKLFRNFRGIETIVALGGIQKKIFQLHRT